MEPIVEVTRVRVLARYVIELTFESGEMRVIDLEPMLDGPVFEPLLNDYELFKQVEVDPEAGTIVWPNGADFDPATLHDWPLYAAELEARAAQWNLNPTN